MMPRMGRPAGHLLVLHLKEWRSTLLLGVLLAWLAALGVRAMYLQVWHQPFLQRKGDAMTSRVMALPAHRGMVSDRHGEVLAISTPVESLWFNPSDDSLDAGQVARLSAVLHMPIPELRHKLADTDHDFVWIKRRLPPDEAAAVTRLSIPGLSLTREYRRYYPMADLLGAVLGFTGVDDNGQEGLELGLQNQLAGRDGSHRVLIDRHGDVIEDVQSILAPKPGQDVQLALDMRLQYVAARALEAAVTANKAKSGSLVMLDARTGEVLAMVNVPSFNPNNLSGTQAWVRRNRVITDEYEPGSTLKPIALTAALDAGEVRPDTQIDTSPGKWQVGNRWIHDAHPEGVLTVEQIIEKSSNVGASKIILSLQPAYFWQKLHDAGFGSIPITDFPGAASGSVRPWQHWRPIEQATMSYGNGISVSLLQLARAYTVFTNHGMLKPISLVKLSGAAPAGEQVFSARSADEMAQMLTKVVTKDGTAPQAALDDYTDAGKTGTAHIPDHGGYSANRYVASFIGFAPANNPRLILAVAVMEPSAGQYYGGSVAGPVFHQVMEDSLHLLNVPPDKALTIKTTAGAARGVTAKEGGT